MNSFDDTYLKYIDGDVDWGEIKEYGYGQHGYVLPKYVFCWICMEEVDRIEIGAHYRTREHKYHRATLFREANAYREQQDGDHRLCGSCPALLASDYTCICRIGWFRYAYDRWYRNLFGYYQPASRIIEEDYPVQVIEDNLNWEVVALRPGACRQQLSSKAARVAKAAAKQDLFTNVNYKRSPR